ncbi:MAG: ATP-binding protein [Alphaproteobacteria bacterium]|nr:ATP-binding protein [Alphaproteobacteria bacterium]
MIAREEYLNKLISLKDKQLIKVVTGMRRSGKSTLFALYRDYLCSNGVSSRQIQFYNFEDADNEELSDYKVLHEHIKTHLVKDKMNYVFLDEIQNVPSFEKAVDSLFIKENVDLYITGSNAYMLSGELATLLSGRYIEIQMQPLSLKEYSSAFPNMGETELFRQYIANSSFPYTIELIKDPKNVRDYLDSLYNTVIVKDISDRKKMTDTRQLKRVFRFMADNIGNLVSIKKISDTMSADKQDISTHTVESYLSYLEESFLLYSVSRYDIKGKDYLRTGEKYYLADVAFRSLLLGDKKQDFGRVLENIVYLELKRRGCQIFVGKSGNQEVDFVTFKGEDTEYYQVALSVLDEQTLKRELSALESISDHNPKFLITLDPFPVISHNGIKQINALDWLLKK